MVLGEHDRSVVEGQEVVMEVETIYTHDQFDNYQNDIGENLKQYSLLCGWLISSAGRRHWLFLKHDFGLNIFSSKNGSTHLKTRCIILSIH